MLPPVIFQKSVERYLLICALGFAGVGALSDIRTRRIPNWLTYTGLGAALLVRGVFAGWPGLRSGLAGLVLGGGLFLVLFLLGAMGGGDVKLMAAVSAWAGPSQVIAISIVSGIAGGILAAGYVILGRRIRLTVLNTMLLLEHHLSSGLRPHPLFNVQDAVSTRIPYAVAIAMGTLFCVANAFGWR